MSTIRIPTPEELRRLRLRAKLTQRELAKRAGVSQSLIARLERGQVNVRLSTLQRILEVLLEAISERETVTQCMKSPIITVNEDDTLEKAINLMDRYGISQLPVLDKDHKVVGTVYESTLLKAVIAHGKQVLSKPVRKYMEEPLPQVPPNTPIHAIEELLLVYPAVLVVDGGKPIGIVTKIDVLRWYTAVKNMS
ncbi:MAG TPA: CBS domain-containing protein [Pyrodictiaceae archaeon]|nr:CBS domain-containing protein [Pyrodictiaceae archaeon]HIP85574.1 CBS domain-containing protein [Pyrodictium sp.]HIQ56058.1 CBS domain-containing protein [Pyrodictium sp.]